LARPNPDHILELDGLRGLACLIVVLFHYVFALVPDTVAGPSRNLARVFALGWIGVDLFFVLSGFLLGGILIDNRNSPDVFRTFYARRAFRIFPLYFAWYALFLGLRVLPGWPPGLFNDSMPAWAYVAYIQNCFDAANGHWGAHWMTITWSLAIEEQFYLLLPAVIVFCPRRQIPGVVWTFIVSAVVIRYGLSLYAPGHGLASYTLLPCRWDALFLGVLGAWAMRQEAFRTWLRENPWFLRASLMTLGVLLALFLHRAPVHNGTVVREAGYTWIAVFCLAFLLSARQDPVIRSVLRVRLLTWLGTISYGVYVMHPAVLWLAHWWVRRQLPEINSAADAGTTLLAFVVTITLATLSYRTFEAPLIRLGRRWRYSYASRVREGERSEQ